MKEWLVAHRGAQKDAKENTEKAFLDAVKYHVSWVELDVHTTSDGIVICHHDFEVNSLDIDRSRFEDLKKSDPDLITFEEAIKAIAGKTPILVEIKPTGTAKYIIETLNRHKSWRIASFKIEVLEELISLGIDKKRLFLLQHNHSFGLIKKAKKLAIGGIGINQRLMTPRIYRRAIYKDLSIYTYVVNSKWQAKLFRLLYPKLLICSDRPDILQELQ